MMPTTSRSAARRPPAPRPELPELRPDETLIAPLPRGRSYRLAEGSDGGLSLVCGIATRDQAAPVSVVRRVTTRRLTR